MKQKGIVFFAVLPLLWWGPPLFAEATFLRTSIWDIERNPSEFYGREVEIRASFYKENDLWVQSLPDAKNYMGFFIIKPGRDNDSSLMGEYFGFVFAPKEMQTQIRLLKQGDKLTIRGKCFEFRSISIDGPGIEASELLSGWGEEARPLSASRETGVRETIFATKTENPVSAQIPSGKEEEGKFNLFLSSKEYQGLRFGDDYVFEGIRLRVEKKEQKE